MRELKLTIDFFKDKEFAGLRCTLDAEMKSLRAQETTPKQVQPITPADEAKLWASHVLGDHSPQALLDTMVFVWTLFCLKKLPGTQEPLYGWI